MITSKLTSEAQTTIPRPIRAANHFATFDEWNSEADRSAYAKL